MDRGKRGDCTGEGLRALCLKIHLQVVNSLVLFTKPQPLTVHRHSPPLHSAVGSICWSKLSQSQADVVECSWMDTVYIIKVTFDNISNLSVLSLCTRPYPFPCYTNTLCGTQCWGHVALAVVTNTTGYFELSQK